jgi:hypothetical protein
VEEERDKKWQQRCGQAKRSERMGERCCDEQQLAKKWAAADKTTLHSALSHTIQAQPSTLLPLTHPCMTPHSSPP